MLLVLFLFACKSVQKSSSSQQSAATVSKTDTSAKKTFSSTFVKRTDSSTVTRRTNITLEDVEYEHVPNNEQDEPVGQKPSVKKSAPKKIKAKKATINIDETEQKAVKDEGAQTAGTEEKAGVKTDSTGSFKQESKEVKKEPRPIKSAIIIGVSVLIVAGGIWFFVYLRKKKAKVIETVKDIVT